MYPVKDDAGRVEEVVLVHNDVTEQRLAEDALRRSERQLRSLIEQSAAGISQTDLTGASCLPTNATARSSGMGPRSCSGCASTT